MELNIVYGPSVMSNDDWYQSQVDIWLVEAQYCESHGWLHMAEGAREIAASFREQQANESKNSSNQQQSTKTTH
jgi:hypothetical protein